MKFVSEVRVWLGGLLVVAGVSSAACGDGHEQVDASRNGVLAQVAGETDALWAQGECDAVYEIRAHGPGGPGTPVTVPVGSEQHPAIVFDPPWGDEQVQMVAWKALTDNKKVLHHWILYEGQANLVGWAPGRDGGSYPEGVGADLPTAKGSLKLDMHYFNLTGVKDEQDQSGLSLCVVKGDHRRAKVAARHIGFSVFAPVMVPANTRGHELKGQCKVTASEPVTMLGVSPHAHTLARHMKLVVVRASGEEVVLHDQDFSFYEQETRMFEEPFVLNDGDEVYTTCTYDNETSKNVGYGESTKDEMCIQFAEYYPKGALNCPPTSLFPGLPRPSAL